MSQSEQSSACMELSYQELVSMVACAEASEAEFDDLVIKHLPVCSECRTSLYWSLKGVVDVLPQIAAKYGASKRGGRLNPVPGIASEVNHIITARPGAPETKMRPRCEYPLMWSGMACLALSCVLFIAAFMRYHNVKQALSAPTRTTSALTVPPQVPGSGPTIGSSKEVNEQFRKERSRVRDLEKNAKEYQEKIRASESHTSALMSQIADAEKTIADLRSAAQEREQRVQVLQEQIKTADRAVDDKSSKLRSADLKLSEAEQQLKQERARSRILDELQSLLAARNLHFADIHDDGVPGNQRFGRVLYAKGQPLLLYAYGLSDGTQLNANVSYHVWGERKDVAKTVKSLGVLQRNSAQVHGWVLSFGDSSVLDQIDSVFVTAEKKQVTKPTGERILSAALGDSANHP